MADSFWLAVAWPWLGGAMFLFLLEYLLRPRPAPFWRRPRAALLIHGGLWSILFSLELILFRRPYFAAANAAALVLLLILVSHSKYQDLFEPFVFQDFDYFLDTVKYPRLYLPFFGVPRVLAATLAIGGTLGGGLWLEKPLTAAIPAADVLGGAAVVCLLGVTALWLGARRSPAVTFIPGTDLGRLGLLASLWCYGAEERKPVRLVAAREFTAPRVLPPGAPPDLVAVQIESFFDVRRLFAAIRPEVLQNFDGLASTACFSGQLTVPAIGANTVRTEFAFLSGLGNGMLGVHQFNPYRSLARRQVPTLATFLKQLGYRTICVHPYHAGFYSRDKIFPLLGFDEFIDVRSFDTRDKSGPFIGDVPLAHRVCRLLDERRGDSRQPVFLFAITMENHGPLHLEHPAAGEEARYFSRVLPKGCEDLIIYARHLANADRMLGLLRRYLESSDRDSWLCLFGDHLPIMAKVYGALGTPDGRTDYIIWNRKKPGAAVNCDLRVDDLGPLLLQKMGLSRSSQEGMRCYG